MTQEERTASTQIRPRNFAEAARAAAAIIRLFSRDRAYDLECAADEGEVEELPGAGEPFPFEAMLNGED